MFSDEFNILVQGRRILNGQVPYRDFFQFITPGSIYLSAAWIKLFGKTIGAIRVFSALQGAFICFLIYIFTQRLRFSKIVTFLVFLFSLTINITFWPIISHHWLSTIMALFSIYFMSSYIEEGKKIYFIFSGLFAGFTLLILQNKGFLILIGIILYLFIDKFLLFENITTISSKFKAFLRDSSIYLFSFLLPFIFFTFYLYKMNAINDFVYDTFYWVMESYKSFNIYPNYFYLGNYYIYQIFTSNDFPLNLYRSRNLLLLGYIPPIIIGLSVLHLIKILTEERELRQGKRAIFLITITGILMFISIFYRSDHIHISFIFPFILLLLGIVFQTWLNLWTFISKSQKIVLSGLIFLLFIYNVNEIIFLFRVINYFRYQIDTPIGNFYTLDKKEAYELTTLLKDIEKIPEEKIFVYSYSPFIYYILDKSNPTRYDILIPGYNTDRQLSEVVETLEKEKLIYIIYDMFDKKISSDPLRYGYPESIVKLNNELNNYIANNFEVIFEIHSYKILKRRK